jgi:acyl homoserine lactone synthase
MKNHIYTGKSIPSDLRESMLRYRHETFVQKLGWQIPGASQELESDEFDRDDTVYILLANSQRQVRGCARLLPTTSPYLLQRHFSSLCSHNPPVNRHIWELSRFAADRDEQTVGAALLKATLVCARGMGADQLIGVTFASIERLFRQYGASVTRVGSSQRIDGRVVVACRMDVKQSLATFDGVVPAVGPEHWRSLARANVTATNFS